MMAAGREYSVVELDGDWLSAISGSVSNGRAEIAQWHAVRRPESVVAGDAQAVGAWIGQELERAEISRRRVILSVPRGEVVLKTLILPRPGEGPSGLAELSAMVRLQMLRQLAVTAEGAPIDYVTLGEEKSKDGAANLNVLAGALPGERFAWWGEASTAGGFKIVRMALRCLGVAALLAELSQRRDAPVLGVSLGPASTELLVVERGTLTFARAVDLVVPEAEAESEAFAERLAVEAKRTWIGFRGGKGGSELETVAVTGAGRLAELVAQRCGAVLEVKGQVVGAPGSARGSNSGAWMEAPSGAALVGVLLDSCGSRETMDFANPRRAPDLNARKRQFALAGVFGAIVLGGLGYVLADQELGRLRTDLELAQSKQREVAGELDQFLVAQARLNHLEQWKLARVDWIAHAKALSELMPNPKLAQLEEFSGTLAASAAFSPKGTYPAGAWVNSLGATFRLGGRMEGRQIASDLRDQLLSSGVYAVQSKGADVPERFSLVLDTTLPTPEPPAPPDDKAKDHGKAEKPAATPPAKTGGTP